MEGTLIPDEARAVGGGTGGLGGWLGVQPQHPLPAPRCHPLAVGLGARKISALCSLMAVMASQNTMRFGAKK